MKKLNFFDYWLIGELIFCLILLLILPQQIKLNFWIILTSKETSGSVLNVFALPLIMALPNIIQRSVSKSGIYWSKLSVTTLIFKCILLSATYTSLLPMGTTFTFQHKGSLGAHTTSLQPNWTGAGWGSGEDIIHTR